MKKVAENMFLRFFTAACLMFFAPCGAFGKIFETCCIPETFCQGAQNEPIQVSILMGHDASLPQNFNIKIDFNNDVFTKSAKINYNEKINKNYKHKKEMSGNVVTVDCALKPSKSAPEFSQNEEILSLNFKPKKSFSADVAEFKITAQSELGDENTVSNIKIIQAKQNSKKPKEPQENKTVQKQKNTPVQTSHSTNTKNETKKIPERKSTQETKSVENNCVMNTYSTPVEHSGCKLLKLAPSEGNLEPPFDPNINEYSLNVSGATKDVAFEAEGSGNAMIKINRHKLKSAGSTTDIYVTAKVPGEKHENKYHIAVNRAEKDKKLKSPTLKSIVKEAQKKINSKKKPSIASALKKSPENKKYDIPDDYKPKKDIGSDCAHSSQNSQNILVQANDSSTDNSRVVYIAIIAIVLAIMIVYAVIMVKKHNLHRKLLNKIFKR